MHRLQAKQKALCLAMSLLCSFSLQNRLAASCSCVAAAAASTHASSKNRAGYILQKPSIQQHIHSASSSRSHHLHCLPLSNFRWQQRRVLPPYQQGHRHGLCTVAAKAGRPSARKQQQLPPPPQQQPQQQQQQQRGDEKNAGTVSLNAQQLAAVEAPIGPIRVVAGPGSGKTRVLMARGERLIRTGTARPHELLIITFTNRAAKELKQRSAVALGPNVCRSLNVGTFHSIGLRMLREDIEILHVGRTRDFIIYDADESEILLRHVVSDLLEEELSLTHLKKKASETSLEQVSTKEFNRSVTLFKLYIEKWKTKSGVEHKKYEDKPPLRFAKRLLPAAIRGLHPASVAIEYENRLAENNAVDFSDLLRLPLRLIRRCSITLGKYQSRWQHVLVDEFQDTNIAQYELVKLLASQHNSLFVVGDGDQAIYGFRDADPTLMLAQLPKDFEAVSTYLLEQNYRSTPNIVKLAGEVIKRSEQDRSVAGQTLHLTPVNGPGADVTVFNGDTGEHEARFVARGLTTLHAADVEWAEMAVLYRTHAQSREIEKQLVKHNIPYQLVGGNSLFDSKVVRDIIAYMKLVMHPEDGISWDRIVNTPTRGIGDSLKMKLKAWASNTKKSAHRMLHEGYVQNDKSLSKFEAAGLKPREWKALEGFVGMIDDLRAFANTATPLNLMQEVLNQTGYIEKALKPKPKDTTSINAGEKQETYEKHLKNLNELMTYANEVDFPGNGPAALQEFLEKLALFSGETARNPTQKADAVTLSTLHASKGLEFDAVFLIGCVDKLLPHAASGSDVDVMDPSGQSRSSNAQSTDEERRLMYVGLTRARRYLRLSGAMVYITYDGVSTFQPSVFLRECAKLWQTVDEYGAPNVKQRQS